MEDGGCREECEVEFGYHKMQAERKEKEGEKKNSKEKGHIPARSTKSDEDGRVQPEIWCQDQNAFRSTHLYTTSFL